MKSVMLRFLLLFIPTCAVAVGACCVGVFSYGFWSVVGWAVAGIVGLLAILQLITLISGLFRVTSWQAAAQQRLQELEERDAELFAQGKSFEEVMSQYEKPRR